MAALVPLTFESGLQPWGRPQSPSDLTREDSSATFSDDAPRQIARFWVERLPGDSLARFRLTTRSAASAAPAPGSPGPVVTLDDLGWPASARWPGMKAPLFEAGLGEFTVFGVDGFAPRWTLHDMADSDRTIRDRLCRDHVRETPGSPGGRSMCSETAHTLLYSQAFAHPRLRWGTRDSRALEK